MAEFAPGTVLAARFELLRPLGAGGLAFQRTLLYVPIENNAFKAAAFAFG